ncbi:AMP-binding protein [Wangella sp. NEAU-J3]|nr:AMP-binding protein [Jidongwangia harbinensis]
MQSAKPTGDELETIIQQFRQQARRTPDAVAASDAAGTVSYAELWRRTEAVAHLLRARGCRPGRPVGLCLSPSVTRLASMLGIMGIGSPYVPIDPAFPDSRSARSPTRPPSSACSSTRSRPSGSPRCRTTSSTCRPPCRPTGKPGQG